MMEMMAEGSLELGADSGLEGKAYQLAHTGKMLC